MACVSLAPVGLALLPECVQIGQTLNLEDVINTQHLCRLWKVLCGHGGKDQGKILLKGSHDIDTMGIST